VASSSHIVGRGRESLSLGTDSFEGRKREEEEGTGQREGENKKSGAKFLGTLKIEAVAKKKFQEINYLQF
jgi:hypothetical protein